MNKIYPSSSAFMWGDLVLTEYDSGCLRNILAKSHNIRTPIPELYAKVGAAHEDNYAARLGSKLHAREMPIKAQVIDGVAYSGRCDFVTQHDGFQVVHECKGTVSKSTRSKVMKGKYKLNHLAQLVSYLAQLKITRGKIVYGYYELDEDDTFVLVESREYKVEVAEDGGVWVDGKRTDYTVADQLAHQFKAATVLKEQVVWVRPANSDAKWGSPCSNCPFKATCDKYDRGDITTTTEFIESAREEARSYQPLKATVNRIKRSKTNGNAKV